VQTLRPTLVTFAAAAVKQLSLKPMAFVVDDALTMMTVDRTADDENKSQSLLDRREVQPLKASTSWIV
jgi:hypothetical protein